ncbi:MAG: T9SS type A sorting domain-containing protein [Bacteroidales bacterium]|nr:T9SS type A sorting domain-containing protein [Bacteroidales bacterium]
MKKYILVSVLFFLNLFLSGQPRPEKAPVDVDYKIADEELEEMQRNGVLLPPVKPAHHPWINIKTQPSRDLPLVYDMRQTPWLTSVKTQSSGGCWAYSVMGAVESRWLMLGMGTYDLSDNNLKYCHKYLPERSTNGNHWMATSYFARRSGPYAESQDPFPGGTTGPDNCPDDLTPLYYINQSRYTPPLDRDFTKQTLLEFGPVWTLMYYNATYFNTVTNTYFYGGTHAVNHAGVIVGWNDTLQTAGGTGAWIVRNTYGPNWGEAGYYYVSFFDAQFLQYNGYWPDVMEHEPDVYLYQYDEIGGYWGVGFGNETGYGLVKFEGAEGLTEITKVGTFVLYAGSGVGINIYEEFNDQLSGLLFSMDEVICDLPGYYTFDLDSTICIPEGKSFYVQIKYDSKNADNKWPIPIEDTIPTYSMPQIETGKYWVAPNPEIWPAAWYQAGHGTGLNYDLCIKTYAKQMPMPPPPFADAGENATLTEGENFAVAGAAALNFTSLLWMSDGDGTLVDETTFNPTYFPGQLDIANGSVNLIFFVTGLPPLNMMVTDTLNLTIRRYPTIEILYPYHQEKICDCALLTSGVASDPDNDLFVVEISVNNGDWLIAEGMGNWSSTISLNPGMNTIKARATDVANLTTESEEIEVICSVQTIFLPEGWSVISGFLIPDEPDVELLLTDIADNLVVIQNMNGMYAPPPINSNTLGNWNSLSGYKIKMLADDQLSFCGDLPESNSVSFSSGYHIIPYLSNRNAAITDLFDNPLQDLLYLFDLSEGKIFWPMGGIYTLTILNPGFGYQGYFLNPLTISFPAYEGFFFSGQKILAMDPEIPWRFKPTGEFHLFSLDSQALNTPGPGFIGAFDQFGQCVGAVQVDEQESENLLLTVFGDDEMTVGKDGAEEGEPVNFRFYNSLNNNEESLIALYDSLFPNAEGTFYPKGMSRIKGFMNGLSTSDPESHTNLIKIYPNPAKDHIMIDCPFEDGKFLLRLLSADGKVIRNLEVEGQKIQIPLISLEKGIYFVKIESLDGVIYRRFIKL